jgi:hypothetical protein
MSMNVCIDYHESGLSQLIMELKKHDDKIIENGLSNYLYKKSK